MTQVSLFHGDCLEVLKGIQPASVDAVITDLPYGTTMAAWDSVIPLGPMWLAVKRVLAVNGVFVTTASQPFTSALIMSNLDWYRYNWVWVKNAPTRFLDAKRRPLLYHEDVVVFTPGRPAYHPQMQRGRPAHSRTARTAATTALYKAHTTTAADQSSQKYPGTVLYFDSVAPSIKSPHPTEKPLSLYKYLVLTYTAKGDTVLDLAMGSGTTGEACMQLERNFIGIEADQAYYTYAHQRITHAANQPALRLQYEESHA